MNSNKKVAVAMSGGVDSSVAAILLKEQGYDVIGVTALMQNEDDIAKKAKAVCDSLGIEHHTLDLTIEFKKEVINYFEHNYANGLTPNPCVICNRKIKWGKLLEYSVNTLGADLYATGHYAKLENIKNNFKLTRAQDENKDQLYMLFELSQSDLSKTIFPVGNITKEKVRKIAEKHDIPSKNSKDSQDICFIAPPDSTKKYLIRTFGTNKGEFRHINTNKKLGTHEGFYQYTIGQRKGIGIAYSEPLYVVKIDAKNNIVYVGEKQNLFSKELILKNINWQQEEFANKISFDAMVKIRYNTTAKPAKISIKENYVHIVFNEDVSAITPGQAAVIYDSENQYLIGGGWIN